MDAPRQRGGAPGIPGRQALTSEAGDSGAGWGAAASAASAVSGLNTQCLYSQKLYSVMTTVDSGLAINYSQHLVVKIIAKNGPQMPGDLARFLDHNAGAMTRLIDRLEEKNYVERKPHAEDRRALTIELTPAGQELWRMISQYIEHAQELALSDFKAADRAKLFELLKRVRNTLDNTP